MLQGCSWGKVGWRGRRGEGVSCTAAQHQARVMHGSPVLDLFHGRLPPSIYSPASQPATHTSQCDQPPTLPSVKHVIIAPAPAPPPPPPRSYLCQGEACDGDGQ